MVSADRLAPIVGNSVNGGEGTRREAVARLPTRRS